MTAELEHLIKLQDIETRVAEAERRIADAPGQIATLDAKLSTSRERVAAAKQAITDNQSQRRTYDKDLIAAQQRLSKYKEQLMAVKTNEEYHAMQHQTAAVSAEIARIEEQILVNMVEADELAAKLKAAETALKADEGSVAKERASIEAETTAKRRILDESVREREVLMPQIGRSALDMFQRLLKARQGIAVAQAVNGHCTVCRMRLRPQVYNTIIKNDAIVQCDSCQRIMYYTGGSEQSATGQAAIQAAESRERDFERPS
jgi:predicted  nucleic acid-binding Zn-ribbon protein